MDFSVIPDANFRLDARLHGPRVSRCHLAIHVPHTKTHRTTISGNVIVRSNETIESEDYTVQTHMRRTYQKGTGKGTQGVNRASRMVVSCVWIGCSVFEANYY